MMAGFRAFIAAWLKRRRPDTPGTLSTTAHEFMLAELIDARDRAHFTAKER